MLSIFWELVESGRNDFKSSLIGSGSIRQGKIFLNPLCIFFLWFICSFTFWNRILLWCLNWPWTPGLKCSSHLSLPSVRAYGFTSLCVAIPLYFLRRTLHRVKSFIVYSCIQLNIKNAFYMLSLVLGILIVNKPYLYHQEFPVLMGRKRMSRKANVQL